MGRVTSLPFVGCLEVGGGDDNDDDDEVLLEVTSVEIWPGVGVCVFDTAVDVTSFVVVALKWCSAVVAVIGCFVVVEEVKVAAAKEQIL